MAQVIQLLEAATAISTGNAKTLIGHKATFQASGKTSSGVGAAVIVVEVSNNNQNWEVASTITLPLGTTSASASDVMDAPWAYARGRVADISGTGAAVDLTMGV